MCNGYPVIRCSAFARNMLDHAQQRVEAANSFEEKELAEKMVEKAESILYTTPAGFKELEDKIDNLPEGVEKDALWSKLVLGKQERRNRVVENRRVQRVNHDKIIAATKLKSEGLAWWVIASQMNLDSIEINHNIKLVTVNDEILDGTACYVMDSKNKTFDVVFSDGTKILSAQNNYSFDLASFSTGENVWAKSLEQQVLNIVNEFAGRGTGSVIEELELTEEQKNIVWNLVVKNFTNNQYKEIYLCEPKFGVQANAEVVNENLKENFEIVLHTPTFIRNGTDIVRESHIPDFLNKIDNSLVKTVPAEVQNKYIIETVRSLTKDEQIVGDTFLLKPIRDNFYEIRKLGRIRGVHIRASLKIR